MEPSLRGPQGRYRHIGDPLAIPARAHPAEIRDAILAAVRLARIDRGAVSKCLDDIELLARAIRSGR